jgi:hypothetical protein
VARWAGRAAFPSRSSRTRHCSSRSRGGELAGAADDAAHDVGRALFAIGLGVWAWEEAIDGVNWLRRFVGAGALVWLVAIKEREGRS